MKPETISFCGDGCPILKFGSVRSS